MIKGIVPALAEGGKIKIGGLGQTQRSGNREWRMPVKLDHFIVTKVERNPQGDLVVDDELMALLPKQGDGHCREIPIVLHDDDLERVFPTTLALYQGKVLVCRGDNEQATRFEMKDGKRTGNSREMACPCPYLGADKAPVCKPHGTLHCSIRIPGRAVAGSVYKWRTTSIISIQRMLGSLQQIRDICGTLTGIPLQLVLDEIRVTPANAPAATVYCCHVELRATDILQVQKQAIEAANMRQRVRASIGYQALIEVPGLDESEDDEAEVGQEFHPENNPDVPPAERGNGSVRLTDILDVSGQNDDPPAATVDLGDRIQAVNTLIDEIERKKPGQGKAALQMSAGQDDLAGLTAEQLDQAATFLRSVAAGLPEPSQATSTPKPPATPAAAAVTTESNGQQRWM